MAATQSNMNQTIGRTFEAVAKSADEAGKSMAAAATSAAVLEGMFERLENAGDYLKDTNFMDEVKNSFNDVIKKLNMTEPEIEAFVKSQAEVLQREAEESLAATLREIQKETGKSVEEMRALAASYDVDADTAEKLVKSDASRWLEEFQASLSEETDAKFKTLVGTTVPSGLRAASETFLDLFSDIAMGTKQSSDLFEELGQSVLRTARGIARDLLQVGMRFVMFGGGEGDGFFGKGGGLFGNLAGGISGLLGFDKGGGLFSTLLGGIKGLFGFAKGDVFAAPALAACSNTIVSRPTYFPFAHGIGLMGEAGAEAIVPLARMSNGDLGIQAGIGAGGGLTELNAPITIQINYTARESSSPREDGGTLAKTLGTALRKELQAFVDQRLIAQTRPGGLLNQGIR